ncbi:ABC transporter permease [Paenirhodobacter populi]|nr:ABC transporter permease [Sinirhodobacter populi]
MMEKPPAPATPLAMRMIRGLGRDLRDVVEGLHDTFGWLHRRPAHLWLRLLCLILMVALWSWLGRVLPRGFFATPGETLSALHDMLHDQRREYPSAILETLRVYLGGMALATIIGIPAGVLLGVVPLLGRALNPFVNALAATPLIALIPMIILFLGLGTQAKIVIVALGVVMPVIVNSYLGVRQTDPDLIEMARAYRLGWLRCLFRVLLPSAFPAIMAGLRLGATTGLVTSVIADFYTAMTGLGALLQVYGNSFRMDQYFVVVLTLAGIGILTTAALGMAERLLTPPPLRRGLPSRSRDRTQP